MLKVVHGLVIFSMTVSLIHPIETALEPTDKIVEPTVTIVEETAEQLAESIDIQEIRVVAEEVAEAKAATVEVEEVVEPEEPAYSLSEEEIELLALVTMAEAEGESEYGKRLVIDTILNRADHEYSYWPDTVTEVIYQKGQFTSMWNGRVDRCYVREDIVQLVREELENRTNSEVLYFRTGRYSSYGTPAFKEGNHYFSNY